MEYLALDEHGPVLILPVYHNGRAKASHKHIIACCLTRSRLNRCRLFDVVLIRISTMRGL